MAATPAYRAAEYVQHSDQHMTTSLAIQDRKKSTTTGKTHASLFNYGMKRSLQVKYDLHGKINQQD
jgi:hypothetical protein